MRWPILLLGLLIAMAAVVIAVVVLGEPPGARGLDNPQFATLLDGDPGVARHERILPFGWLLGVLIMAFAAALLAWGYRRRGRLGRVGWMVLGVFVVQVLCFSAALIAYASSLGDPTPTLWWALPVPTAWLVYLFWPSQFGFLILYVVTFDRWFWTPDDEARFAAILRRKSEAGEP
jgi:hypothetical protein